MRIGRVIGWTLFFMLVSMVMSVFWAVLYEVM